MTANVPSLAPSPDPPLRATAAKAARIVPPGRPLVGRVAPPGSKSITNRALLLAALAKGTSQLSGALKSDDTAYMATALRQMGVEIGEPDDTTFVVRSNGHWTAPPTPLFVGNAGTVARFLTAAAATVVGPVVIDGNAYMRKRPIAPLVAALRTLGLDVRAETGCPPVVVHGTGGFDGGRVQIDSGLTSQYVSALLMLAACGRTPTEVALAGNAIGARGYVDLTLAAMQAFGAAVQQIGDGVWRVQPTGYRAADLAIEPDASAATYLWAAAALTGGTIDLGLAPGAFSQPDARAYDLIAKFPCLPTVIEGSQMQDAVPTLAVLAAFNDTPVRFTGIANLRVKECDRIAALAQGLTRIAPALARVEGDDLVVAGKEALPRGPVAAGIDPFADHRIAMSFALAGLRIGGLAILDPDCVAKTYPGYWEALRSLGVEVDIDNSRPANLT